MSGVGVVMVTIMGVAVLLRRGWRVAARVGCSVGGDLSRVVHRDRARRGRDASGQRVADRRGRERRAQIGVPCDRTSRVVRATARAAPGGRNGPRRAPAHASALGRAGVAVGASPRSGLPARVRGVRSHRRDRDQGCGVLAPAALPIARCRPVDPGDRSRRRCGREALARLDSCRHGDVPACDSAQPVGGAVRRQHQPAAVRGNAIGRRDRSA